MNIKAVFMFFTLIALVFFICGCEGTDEKKARFFERGKALYEKGDYVNARLELKNAAQLDPKFTQAHYLLGMAALQTGNHREAFSAFSRVVNLVPLHLDANLQLGKMFLAANMTDEALEKAEIILNEAPEHEEAVMLKASAFLAKKDPGRSMALLEDLLNKGSSPSEVYLLLASAHILKNRHLDAEKILLEGIDNHPGVSRLHLALARLYAENDNIAKALASMDEVIALEPGIYEYKETLAGLYWRAGEKEKALEILKRPVLAEPENEEARLSLVSFLINSHQQEKALRELEEGCSKIPSSFNLRFALAEMLTNMGNPHKAIPVLMECLKIEKDPANREIIKTKLALADVYLVLRDADSAERFINEVLENNPGNVEARFRRAKVFMMKQQPSRAVSDLRAVVNDRPELISGHLHLAEAHAMNNELLLAIDILQRAIDTNPRSKELRNGLATLLIRKQDFKSAEAQLQWVAQYYPSDFSALVALGDFYMQQGQVSNAESVYFELKEKFPENPIASLKLANLYRIGKKPEYALKELHEAQKAHPDSRRVFESLINFYLYLEKLEEAAALSQKQMESNPEDAFFHNIMGKVLALQKKYSRSEKFFEEAIRLEPFWSEPVDNLAKILLVQGKTEDAVRQFEKSIANNPENVPAYLSLAHLHYIAKNYDQAKQVHTRALEKFPDLWLAANNLAFLKSEFPDSPEDLEEALKYAESAYRLRPDEAQVAGTLGWVYYKLGDHEKAVPLLEKAVTKQPESAILNYHLGMALYKSGEIESASGFLKKAVEAAEDFVGKDKALRTLREVAGS